MQASGDLPLQNKLYSIYDNPTVGSFKFCVIHKSVPGKSGLSTLDEFILNTKYRIRKLAGSKVKWYGLDNSTIIYEKVPVIIGVGKSIRRIQRAEKNSVAPSE